MLLLPPSLSAIVAASAETVLRTSHALLPLYLTVGFSTTRPQCWMPLLWLDLLGPSSRFVYIFQAEISDPPPHGRSLNAFPLLAVVSMVGAKHSVQLGDSYLGMRRTSLRLLNSMSLGHCILTRRTSQVRVEQGQFLDHNYMNNIRGPLFALQYEQLSQSFEFFRTFTV